MIYYNSCPINKKINIMDFLIISIMDNATMSINRPRSTNINIRVVEGMTDIVIFMVIIMIIRSRMMAEMQVWVCRQLSYMHYVFIYLFSWYDNECRVDHFFSDYIFVGQSRQRLQLESYRVEPLASVRSTLYLLIFYHRARLNYSRA